MNAVSPTHTALAPAPADLDAIRPELTAQCSDLIPLVRELVTARDTAPIRAVG